MDLLNGHFEALGNKTFVVSFQGVKLSSQLRKYKGH